MLRALLRTLGRLRNELDFPLRQAIRWRRPGVRLPAESKENLFSPAGLAEARRLVERYGLEAWERQSERRAFAASLFYLQMAERAFEEGGVTLPATGGVTALDAGCGDWFYVQALHALLQRFGIKDGHPRRVRLDGVELDAYCLYPGLRTRQDWAEAYAAGLPETRYIPGDLRAYSGEVEMAFLFFPYIFAPDLIEHGRLPARFLRPGEYLAHVWGRVKPGGWLVIVNLGPAEQTEQRRLLDEAGLPVAWSSRHESDLYRYREPCYVTAVGPKRA